MGKYLEVALHRSLFENARSLWHISLFEELSEWPVLVKAAVVFVVKNRERNTDLAIGDGGYACCCFSREYVPDGVRLDRSTLPRTLTFKSQVHAKTLALSV